MWGSLDAGSGTGWVRHLVWDEVWLLTDRLLECWVSEEGTDISAGDLAGVGVGSWCLVVPTILGQAVLHKSFSGSPDGPPALQLSIPARCSLGSPKGNPRPVSESQFPLPPPCQGTLSLSKHLSEPEPACLGKGTGWAGGQAGLWGWARADTERPPVWISPGEVTALVPSGPHPEAAVPGSLQGLLAS